MKVDTCVCMWANWPVSPSVDNVSTFDNSSGTFRYLPALHSMYPHLVASCTSPTHAGAGDPVSLQNVNYQTNTPILASDCDPINFHHQLVIYLNQPPTGCNWFSLIRWNLSATIPMERPPCLERPFSFCENFFHWIPCKLNLSETTICLERPRFWHLVCSRQVSVYSKI